MYFYPSFMAHNQEATRWSHKNELIDVVFIFPIDLKHDIMSQLTPLSNGDRENTYICYEIHMFTCYKSSSKHHIQKKLDV